MLDKTCMIMSIIIMLLFFASIIFIKDKKYIHLDECERLSKQSVVFKKGKPYYATYFDCSQPPRSLRIKDYTFVEK